jgi:hypothetical protein
MYRPNPFKLSTLHEWILQSIQELHGNHDNDGNDEMTTETISPIVVMKHIHKTHPGVLFSPHWFNVQYKRVMAGIVQG